MNIVNSLPFFIFILSLQYFYRYLNIETTYAYFIFYCGLVYIFMPFNYISWNAKNTGISARGFGLLLGQGYLYLIIFYILTNNKMFLIFMIFIAFLIVISSQFSFQFLLFTSPFLSFFYKEWIFILIPIIVILIYFIIMPKIALNYFKGQYSHKKIYYKYLADIFILKNRPSIWRDIIYDFWIKLRADVKKGLIYIWHNPIVEIIYGIPYLWIIFYFVLTDITMIGVKNTNILITPILSALFIFFLTSFRKTRFLGEPQRYLEFIIPLISIVTILILKNKIFLNSIIVILLIVILNQWFWLYVSVNKINKKFNVITRRSNILTNYFKNEKKKHEDIKIISNNINLVKYLMAMDLKIYLGDFTNEYSAGLHFKELFPKSYPILSERAIFSLIKAYTINYLILDTCYYDLNRGMKSALKFKQEFENDDITIYKISRANG